MGSPLAIRAITGDRLGKEQLEKLARNEKMAELGRLATGMVHEINTPLSVINSAAQMILREEQLSDFVREMVERICSESQRLAQFSRGLLSFSRRDETGDDETNLARVMDEVIVFLRYEAQKRSIVVVEKLDFRLPAVQADANHLKQIFINLIMNALQATGPGGALRVRTYLTVNNEVEAEIADTGAGISSEVQQHIFEPFFTTKGPDEGTGLGLFIVARIIELYGGRIRVNSQPGKGTSFFVTLPAVGESEGGV